MDLGIKGRKAIVNGGSAGLGFASAMALAREGADLFVSARGEERLVEACTAISTSTGASVTPIVADHSSEDGRERIIAACPAPDIFVGTSSPPRLVLDYRTIGDDELRQAVEVGLMSPFRFMQAIVGGMAERGWGRIVNIASSAVKFPLEMRILSGAPRAALVNYAVSISKAVARHNVTINTLLPALHLTEGTRAIFEPIARNRGATYEEEIARQVEALALPAGRFGDAHDFGSVVAFLCGVQANYITGQSLVVDGGLANSVV
jgi:3-oxoacyl-[acyl-carrier protein] reductase